MGVTFSCELEPCRGDGACSRPTGPSPCCQEGDPRVLRGEPTRLIVRVAAARPQDLRDVAELARPVVTTSLQQGGAAVEEPKLRSVPGAWNPDVGLWVWHRESFRFNRFIDDGIDLAVRLLLIGPRSPRSFDEEPPPYAVSGATIALKDVFSYMVELPRERWTFEQKIEAGVLEAQSAKERKGDRSKGQHLESVDLCLYQTDWLTFAFEPLCELTLAFEVFSTKNPRKDEGPGVPAVADPLRAPQSTAPRTTPREQKKRSSGVSGQPGIRLSVRLDMSQPQLGVSFEPGPPPRVSRVEPDHALAHAGIVIGDALVAVDGTDVSAMELGSVLPLLVSRPIELTFSRDFLPAAVRAESSRLPEPEGDSNFTTVQPQEVA